MKRSRPMTADERHDERMKASGLFELDFGNVRHILPMKEIARILHRKLTPRERYELIRYLNLPRL